MCGYDKKIYVVFIFPGKSALWSLSFDPVMFQRNKTHFTHLSALHNSTCGSTLTMGLLRYNSILISTYGPWNSINDQFRKNK